MDKTAKEAALLGKSEGSLEDGNCTRHSSSRMRMKKPSLFPEFADCKTGDLCSYVSEEIWRMMGRPMWRVAAVREYGGKREAVFLHPCPDRRGDLRTGRDEKLCSLEDLGLKESDWDKLVKASYASGTHQLDQARTTRTGRDDQDCVEGLPRRSERLHMPGILKGALLAEVVNYKDLELQGPWQQRGKKGL